MGVECCNVDIGGSVNVGMVPTSLAPLRVAPKRSIILSTLFARPATLPALRERGRRVVHPAHALGGGRRRLSLAGGNGSIVCW